MPCGACFLNDLSHVLEPHVLHLNLDRLTFQIAEGMAFLEKEHFVHRNLGARNILVGERNVVKIAGFGMAKVQDDPDFNFRRGT